jgi:hypothetical protein
MLGRPAVEDSRRSHEMRELDKRVDYLRAEFDRLVKRVEALEGQKSSPEAPVTPTEAFPDCAVVRVNGCGRYLEIDREVG